MWSKLATSIADFVVAFILLAVAVHLATNWAIIASSILVVYTVYAMAVHTFNLIFTKAI